MPHRTFALVALVSVLLIYGIARAQAPVPVAYLPAIARAPSPTRIPPSPTVALSPTATSEPTPTPPPPDFESCGIVGDPARAPEYPLTILDINKSAETVTLGNMTDVVIDLTGWRMCSVTGAQTHPISGQLGPFEERTFPGPAALIWNNSSSDPGALWNPNGSLISYWPD